MKIRIFIIKVLIQYEKQNETKQMNRVYQLHLETSMGPQKDIKDSLSFKRKKKQAT